jgi:hypothetical protein
VCARGNTGECQTGKTYADVRGYESSSVEGALQERSYAVE